MKQTLALILASGITCPLGAAQPNILFLAVDDLRPDLGAYELTAAEQMGGSRLPVLTPNIDRIAGEGVVFERAYCQQAVCGPSRISLMTGTYPDRFGIYGMGKKLDWREMHPDLVTIPQQLRKHGYETVGLGKIFDDRLGLDDEMSWDTMKPAWKPMYALPENRAAEKAARAAGKPLPALEAPDVDDSAYTDGHITDLAIDFLKNRPADKPFFLAVGYPKPHLPFAAPKKYWDLYDPQKLPLASVRTPPKGASEHALSPYKEIFDYTVGQPIEQDMERQLVHGYLACISYVDAQIGRLMQTLKDRGLDDNTIVVIWGDHGFKLGDFGEWAKATNLEIDTRVPLIVRLPGASAAGQNTGALAEFVDLLPTLCEAAGVPVPETAQGRSLLPVLNDAEASVREFAFSQYPRGPLMGYSARSKDWRYTEWVDRKGKVVDRELYAMEPATLEAVNVVDAEPEVAAKHSAALMQFRNQPGPEKRP